MVDDRVSQCVLPFDLQFVLREKLDKTFKRDGDDLRMDFTISLLDALTGFTKKVSIPLKKAILIHVKGLSGNHVINTCRSSTWMAMKSR